MIISTRGWNLPDSPIRKLTPIADTAKLNGKKIYHLNIGQPDLHTPEAFFKAIHEFDNKIIGYTASEGLIEYRKKLVEYYKLFGIEVAIDEILVTVGGSEAILFSFFATCDAGDEVIVTEPFYANYNGYAAIAGIKLVPITTHIENNFEVPDQKAFEELITPKTKAILICNPSNPSGNLYTDDELRSLIKICIENNLYLISDEVYKELCFDGTSFNSILEFPELGDRGIVIDSVSKKYSACGARIGSLVTKNKSIMQVVVKMARTRLSAPILEQVGAMALIDLKRGDIIAIRNEYQKRRDIVLESLGDLNGVYIPDIKGSIYAMIKLPINDTDHLAQWLLEEFELNGESVMIAPGSGFYSTPGIGKSEIRIAFVLTEIELKKALNILKAGIEEYRKHYN